MFDERSLTTDGATLARDGTVRNLARQRVWSWTFPATRLRLANSSTRSRSSNGGIEPRDFQGSWPMAGQPPSTRRRPIADDRLNRFPRAEGGSRSKARLDSSNLREFVRLPEANVSNWVPTTGEPTIGAFRPEGREFADEVVGPVPRDHCLVALLASKAGADDASSPVRTGRSSWWACPATRPMRPCSARRPDTGKTGWSARSDSLRATSEFSWASRAPSGSATPRRPASRSRGRLRRSGRRPRPATGSGSSSWAMPASTTARLLHLPGPDLRDERIRRVVPRPDRQGAGFWMTTAASGRSSRHSQRRGGFVVAATERLASPTRRNSPTPWLRSRRGRSLNLTSTRTGRSRSAKSIWRRFRPSTPGSRPTCGLRPNTPSSTTTAMGSGPKLQSDQKTPRPDGSLASKTFLPIVPPKITSKPPSRSEHGTDRVGPPR